MSRLAETDFIRVLVVEDDADNASALSDLLEIWGYSSMVARDGVEALDAVREHLPDIILLDLGLPLLDGWEFARKLVTAPMPKRPFVIALSGFNKKPHETGVDLHLVKPVEPAALLRILERFERAVRCEQPIEAVA